MMKRLSLMGMLVAAGLPAGPVIAADTIVVGTYPANPPWEYKTARAPSKASRSMSFAKLPSASN